MLKSLRQSKTLRVAAILSVAVISVGACWITARTTLFSQDSDNNSPLAAKQAEQERLADVRATALAMPTAPRDYHPPIETHVPYTPFSPFEHVPAGNGTIVENGQAPVSPLLYMFENKWYMETPEYTLVVYAGIARNQDDPRDFSQGVLVVVVLPKGRNTDILKQVPSGEYRTPQKDGALRIVGADGSTLRVASAGGTAFEFDIGSRTLTATTAQP